MIWNIQVPPIVFCSSEEFTKCCGLIDLKLRDLDLLKVRAKVLSFVKVVECNNHVWFWMEDINICLLRINKNKWFNSTIQCYELEIIIKKKCNFFSTKFMYHILINVFNRLVNWVKAGILTVDIAPPLKPRWVILMAVLMSSRSSR